MNPSEDPYDRLVDSLLREASRHRSADPDLIASIEAALDRQEAARPRGGASSSRRGLLLACAAAVIVTTAGVLTWKQSQARNSSPQMAMAEQQRSAVTAAPTKPAVEESAGKTYVPPPITALLPEVAMKEKASGPGADTESFSRLTADRNRDSDPFASEFSLPDSSLPPADLASAESRRGTGGTGGGSGGGLGTGTGTGIGRGVGPAQNGVPAPDLGIARSTVERSDIARSRIAPPSAPSAPPAESAAPSVLSKSLAASRSQDVAGPRAAPGSEKYGQIADPTWKTPLEAALSTFSIDVDSASYTNVRRMILDGKPVPPDAVRIEECVNYFDYDYPQPEDGKPFAVTGTVVTSPLANGSLLARVAIKGREVKNDARPPCNLVFLIDVSGSMESSDKLPLLKRSMTTLIHQLGEKDQIAIAVYAGSDGVALKSTRMTEEGKRLALEALNNLSAQGGTNGGAGIQRAYQLATENRIPGGVNRVILATDGDFNVGVTNNTELVNMVKERAAEGVNLTVTAMGTGNLNDSLLESISKDGDGNYYYIDSDEEANRIFTQKLSGTLMVIAKDVKIQVEFNPGKVQAYRLIGYADRVLKNEDFNNDKVDAGDIGAGHTVTAFYEIVPIGGKMPGVPTVDPLRYQRSRPQAESATPPADREIVPSDDWFTLKLRYKAPEGNVSSLIETPVKGEAQTWDQAGNDMRFASAVALFGMKLRAMPEASDLPWSKVLELANPAVGKDPEEQRSGFVKMVQKLAGIRAGD